MNKVKFQYFSELHLELVKKPFKPCPAADYLILAGDIGNIHCNFHRGKVTDFLKYCSTNWKTVIYVPGNHEFYKTSISEGKNILKEICAETDVRLLCPGVTVIDGITIVGDTLWTHVPEYDEDIVSCGMNDYAKIENFTVEDSNKLHKDGVHFIKSITDSQPKCLVVTHHVPDLDIATSPSGGHMDLSSAFGTSIIKEFKKENIVAWIYGHTHMNRCEEIEGVKVICNQKGYPKQRLKPPSSLNMKLEIDSAAP